MGLLDIKGRVTGFILEYLGQYLEGLDRKQLRLKLWAGDLVIKNVRLRGPAFDELLQDMGGLPLCLMNGTVDELHLRVPWSSLKSESVVVTLSGVRGVAAPCKAKAYDHNAWLRRKKEASLARWEAQRQASASSSSSSSVQDKEDTTNTNSSTWVGRLKNVILENLQVVVRDVHLRCEDCVSSPLRAAFVGVRLDSIGLAATTADGDSETFVHNPAANQAYKILHVENLQLYVAPDTEQGLRRSWCLSEAMKSKEEKTEKIPEKQKETSSWWKRKQQAEGNVVSDVAKDGKALREALGDGVGLEDVVLRPVTCRAKVVLQKCATGVDTPFATTKVHLPQLHLALDKPQYEYLMQFSRFLACEAELLSNTSLLALRPPPLCRPSLKHVAHEAAQYYTADCRRWWQFAINAVLSQIRAQRRTHTKHPKTPQVNEADVEAYTRLHTKVAANGANPSGLGGGPAQVLSPVDLAAYNALQSCLPLDVLIGSRKAVHAALQKMPPPTDTEGDKDSDKDSEDGELLGAVKAQTFAFDCKADGCVATLTDRRGAGACALIANLEDLQVVFRGGSPDGYQLTCLLYNAWVSFKTPSVQRVLVAQRDCGDDVPLSAIYDAHVVKTPSTGTKDTGEPLLYVDMRVAHTDGGLGRIVKTVSTMKCTLGALVVAVAPDVVTVLTRFANVDMSNTPNSVTNGLGKRAVSFAGEELRRSFDTDVQQVVSLQLDMTAPCFIADAGAAVVVSLGRIKVKDAKDAVSTYSYELQGLRAALCGTQHNEHLLLPVGLAGTFRPEALRHSSDTSELILEMNVTQVIVSLSERTVCATAALMHSYTSAVVPTHAKGPVEATPLPIQIKRAQQMHFTLEGLAICFEEMTTAKGCVYLCTPERTEVDVLIGEHDASEVKVTTGGLRGGQCGAEAFEVMLEQGALPTASCEPFLHTDGRVGVCVAVPPGDACVAVSLHLGHVSARMCRELVFFFDFLCRTLRALEVLTPSDDALAIARPAHNPLGADVTLLIDSAYLDLQTPVDGEDVPFLTADTRHVAVHVASYQVGVDVAISLRYLDLQAVLEEGTQSVALVGTLEDGGGEAPFTIGVQTPGPMLAEAQQGSGVKCHSADVQVAASDAAVHFYFPQFDTVIDYFLIGHVDRLICLPDLFQLPSAAAVFSAPLDKPLPPSTKEKGPPHVTVDLSRSSGKLPLTKDSKIGLHATAETVHVETHLSYEGSGVMTEPSRSCSAASQFLKRESFTETVDIESGVDAEERGLLWMSITIDMKGIKAASSAGASNTFLDGCDISVGVENLLKVDSKAVRHMGFRLYLDIPILHLDVTRYEYVMLLDVIFFNFMNTPPTPLPLFTSFATTPPPGLQADSFDSYEKKRVNDKSSSGEAQYIQVRLGAFAATFDKSFVLGGGGLDIAVRKAANGDQDIKVAFPNFAVSGLGLEGRVVTRLLEVAAPPTPTAFRQNVHVRTASAPDTVNVDVALHSVSVDVAQDALVQLQEILLNDDSLYAVQSFANDANDTPSLPASPMASMLSVAVKAAVLDVEFETLCHSPLLALHADGCAVSVRKASAVQQNTTTEVGVTLQNVHLHDFFCEEKLCMVGGYGPNRCAPRARIAEECITPVVDLHVTTCDASPCGTCPRGPTKVFCRVKPTNVLYRHHTVTSLAQSFTEGPLIALLSKARQDQTPEVDVHRTHLDVILENPCLVVPSLRRTPYAGSQTQPDRIDDCGVLSIAEVSVSNEYGKGDVTTAAVTHLTLRFVSNGVSGRPVVSDLTFKVESQKGQDDEDSTPRETIFVDLPEVAVNASRVDVATVARIVAGNLMEGHTGGDAFTTPVLVPDTPEGVPSARLATYLNGRSPLLCNTSSGESHDTSHDGASETSEEVSLRRLAGAHAVVATSLKVTTMCPSLTVQFCTPAGEAVQRTLLSANIAGLSYHHSRVVSVEYSEMQDEGRDSFFCRLPSAAREGGSVRPQSFNVSSLGQSFARVVKKTLPGPTSSEVTVESFAVLDHSGGDERFAAAPPLLRCGAEGGGGEAAVVVNVGCVPPSGPEVAVTVAHAVSLCVVPRRLIRLAEELGIGQLMSDVSATLPPEAPIDVYPQTSSCSSRLSTPAADVARSPLLSPLSASSPPLERRKRHKTTLFALNVSVPNVSFVLLEEVEEEVFDVSMDGAPALHTVLRSVARLCLGRSHVSMKKHEGRMARMKGKLGNLQIYDDRPSNSVPREILGLAKPEADSEGGLVTIEYGPYERSRAKQVSPSSQQFAHHLTLVVRSLQLQLVVGFLVKLQEVAHTLMADAAPLVAETREILAHEAKHAVASKGSDVSVYVRIDHPLVTLPDEVLVGNSMHIDLGMMTLNNALEESTRPGEREEVMTAELAGLMVSTSSPSSSSMLLEAPIRIHCTARRLALPSAANEDTGLLPLGPVPSLLVAEMHADAISVLLSDTVYLQAVSTLHGVFRALSSIPSSGAPSCEDRFEPEDEVPRTPGSSAAASLLGRSFSPDVREGAPELQVDCKLHCASVKVCCYRDTKEEHLLAVEAGVVFVSVDTSTSTQELRRQTTRKRQGTLPLGAPPPRAAYGKEEPSGATVRTHFEVASIHGTSASSGALKEVEVLSVKHLVFDSNETAEDESVVTVNIELDACASLTPEIWLSVSSFFVAPVHRLTSGLPIVKPEPLPALSLSKDLTLEEDLVLGEEQYLRVKEGEHNTVTIFGNGHKLVLIRTTVDDNLDTLPLFVEDNTLLVLSQCVVELRRRRSNNVSVKHSAQESLDRYVFLDGPSAGLLCDPARNHFWAPKTKERAPSRSPSHEPSPSPLPLVVQLSASSCTVPQSAATQMLDTSFISAIPLTSIDNRTRIVKVTADVRVKGRLTLAEAQSCHVGCSPLVLSLEGRADASRRVRLRDGASVQVLGTFTGSKVQLAREDGSSTILDRVRVDTFFRSGRAPKVVSHGRQRSMGALSIEAMSSEVSATVSYSDIMFAAVFIETLKDAARANTRLYQSASSSPRSTRTKLEDVHEESEASCCVHGSDLEDETSHPFGSVEFKIPSLALLVVDDSSRAVNLPLYDVKLSDVAANVQFAPDGDDGVALYTSSARLSTMVHVNHYNSQCCEWEAVLEKAPLGLTLDLQPSGALGLSVVGVSGLSVVVTPSFLACVNHTKNLFTDTAQEGEADVEDKRDAGDVVHNVPSKAARRYPTQIHNTLPEPIVFYESASAEVTAENISGATIVKPLEVLSMLTSGTTIVRHPYSSGGKWHSLNTSNLGCTQLSDGVVSECKLENGVKVLTIKTLLTITNSLQESVQIAGLGVLPPQSSVSLPEQRVGERLRLRIAVDVASDEEEVETPADAPESFMHMLPSLPYSEIVHNCTHRGSYELPLSHESGYYIVVNAMRDAMSGRVELTLFPSFEVQNLTGRSLELDFSLHVEGELLASASLADGKTLQLTSLDPTMSLFVNPRAVQPGGEVLSLAGAPPICIKRGTRSSALHGEKEVISTTLTAPNPNVLPLTIDTSYPLSGRQAQLTCKYWVVNHTYQSFYLVHKGRSVLCPAQSDSPVLFSPHGSVVNIDTEGDTSAEELVVEAAFRVLGAQGNSFDSRTVPLHVLGAEGTVGIQNPDAPSQQILIAYRTAFSGGTQGYRTRVIEILPRWAFLNTTKFPVIKMRTEFGVVDLKQNEPYLYQSHPFSTAESGHVAAQNVSFAVSSDTATETSCDINISQLAEVTFKLPVVSNGAVTREYVTCSMKGDPTGYVSLEHTVPPFNIVNRTPYEVSLWQQGQEARKVAVASRKSCAFGWDDASGKMAVKVQVFSHVSDAVDVFDTDRGHTPILCLPTSDVFLEMFPTKDDRVTDVVIFQDPLLAARSSKTVRLATETSKNLSLKIDLARVCVSLVRQEELREVACLTLHGVFFQCIRGLGQDVVQVGVHNLQLDDMSESKPLFPVVLSTFDGCDAAQSKTRQFLTASVILKATLSQLLHFSVISLDMCPVAISVGDRFLWEVFEFKREVSVSLGIRLAPSKSNSASYYIKRCGYEAEMSSRRVYYDVLEVSPVVVTITVDRLKEGRDPYRDRLGLGNFALALPSVKDGMVTLNRLSVSRGRDTLGMLCHRVATYYAKEMEASHNLAGIIGRIQAIGNPLGLFSNITTGVKDFVVLPALGLTKSPGEFGAGVIKGTGSLVGKSVGGVLGTVAGLTRGGARVFESAADNAWQLRRAIEAKGSKRNPFEAPVKGVFDGVVGIVKEPFVGALQGGAVGGIVGAGRGLVGAVAKPVSGVLNGISDTAAILERAILLKSTHDRIREPRYYDPESQAAPASLQHHETYENQRWYFGIGWSSSLLPLTDFPKWSQAQGKASLTREDYPLPLGQVWVGPWSEDKANSGSDSGWCYAIDFNSAFHESRHELDFVRRRRWVRPAMLASELEHEPPTDEPTSPRYVGQMGIASPFIELVCNMTFCAVFTALYVPPQQEKRIASRLAIDEKPEDAYDPVHSGLVVTLETCENQKYRPGIGWTNQLDLTDCWRWSDSLGKERREPKATIVPPDSHKWCSPWEVVGGDKNGWYVFD